MTRDEPRHEPPMREIVRTGYETGSHHETYRKDRELNTDEKRFFEWILTDTTSGDRVLDLCCGSGVPFDDWFIAHDRDVFGIDIAKNNVATARELVPSATYVRGDVTDASLIDGRFAAAICLYALVHIPREDHGEFFAAVAGHLEPNGVFAVMISDYAQEPRYDTYAGGEIVWNAWSPEKTKRLLRDAGFSIDDETTTEEDAAESLTYRFLYCRKR